MSVLRYRDPVTGDFLPLYGEVPPPPPPSITGAVTAGNGLTGGGDVTTNPAVHVGVGPQLSVAADSVDINNQCTTITDWNAATKNGWYRANNAANHPSTFATGWWYGWVVAYSTAWVTQFAIPFAQNGLDHNAMEQRHCFNGIWDTWARVGNYVYSWDYLDNFITLRHGGNSSTAEYGITRFAMGTRQSTNTPTSADAWRVQCYTTGGDYSWTAIQIPESGVVSFPKGSAMLMEARQTRAPIPGDRAATVEVVQQMIADALAQAGVAPRAQVASTGPAFIITDPEPVDPPGPLEEGASSA